MKYGSHKVKYDIMFLFLAENATQDETKPLEARTLVWNFQQIDNNIAFVKATRDCLFLWYSILTRIYK